MSIEESLERIAAALEEFVSKYDAPTVEEALRDSSIYAPPPPPVTVIASAPWDTAAVPEEEETPPSPPSLPGVVELDTAGYPWDARIHASVRTKIKKTGEWKLARNVDPALVAQVRNEYKPANGAITHETLAPVPPPPPAPAPTADLTFPAFVKLVTDAGYTVTTMAPFLQKVGVTALPLLAKDPATMLAVAKEMGLI